MVFGASEKELKEKLSLYHGETVMNVDEVVRDVPFHTKAGLWMKLPNGGRPQCSVSLGTYITYSLRNRQCIPDELVRLLARYYPDLTAVLGLKDATARKYFRYFRDTMGELERLKAHVRFRPSGDALYAEIAPQHDVKGLFMEWAMRRIPDRPLAIKCHSEYYVLNARSQGYPEEVASVTKEEAERLLGDMPETDNEIWDTFYHSQYVESRRNKKYAKSRLPEKYSYISPEIRRERKMIEHGIPETRLDRY